MASFLNLALCAAEPYVRLQLVIASIWCFIHIMLKGGIVSELAWCGPFQILLFVVKPQFHTARDGVLFNGWILDWLEISRQCFIEDEDVLVTESLGWLYQRALPCNKPHLPALNFLKLQQLNNGNCLWWPLSTACCLIYMQRFVKATV